MAITYTTNCGLRKMALNDPDWHLVLDANADQLDAISAIGGLATRTLETPSTSLNVKVAAGRWIASDGTENSFGGSASLAIPDNVSRYVYLDSAGAIAQGTAFPATVHIPIAVVTTLAGVVTAIVDRRMAFRQAGPGSTVYLPLAGGTMGIGANIATNTTTGTMFGTASTQKIGFWGATAVVRPSAFTQTYALADKTISAYTADAESTVYTGAADSEAKLADLNALRVAVENLRLFAEDVAKALNSLIDDLQQIGLIG